MITENYVSFEIAKLLKEKGFDEICEYEYGVPNVDGGYVLRRFFKSIQNCELIDDAYTAPTLQMAMKWLREVHKLYIGTEPYWFNAEHSDIHDGWFCNITHLSDLSYDGDWDSHKKYPTYEEACEAAIKYCLENLI